MKPGSKKNEVIKEDETHFVVRVTARAVDGKANDAVVRVLADYFGCPISALSIVSGRTSRMKRLEKAF